MKKKTALVTGGARGIGFGVSMELAKSGFDLVLCGRKEKTELIAQIDELKKAGAEVSYLKCDVSSANDREYLLSELKNNFGEINVLVNNAGVAPKTRKDILQITEEDFYCLININLTGAYIHSNSISK